MFLYFDVLVLFMVFVLSEVTYTTSIEKLVYRTHENIDLPSVRVDDKEPELLYDNAWNFLLIKCCAEFLLSLIVLSIDLTLSPGILP